MHPMVCVIMGCILQFVITSVLTRRKGALLMLEMAFILAHGKRHGNVTPLNKVKILI